MCCFSGVVRWVGKTRIYARVLPGNGGRWQRLVYQMSVATAGDVAMILPLPVARAAGAAAASEAALRFIDLKAWPRFFDDLDKAFPVFAVSGAPPPRFAPQPASIPKTLVVHQVGDFEASFVPSIADFTRLDARFRMPTSVWASLPEVADYAFAVFQLRDSDGATKPARPRGIWPFSLFTRDAAPSDAATNDRRDIHPMAFDFERADASRLFFPTLHVHDGAVHAEADFDHQLYAQGLAPAHDGGLDLMWQPSSGDLEAVVKPLLPDLIDARAPAWKATLHGHRENADTLVAAASIGS